MDTEEIKKGDKVNLTLLVTDIVDFGGEKSITAELPTGRIFMIWQSDFEALSPANGTKNTEPAPKYEPCRKFRKRDIVEPCKGREVYACEWEDCVFHKLEGTYEVQADEKEGHVSVIEKETGIECYVSAFALELVTPVEELERYYIEHDSTGYAILDRQNVGYVAHFKEVQHPHAKEAAEAERDRLNAEHRKEQE